MAKLSGANLYVSFAGTDISANIRNFNTPRGMESADATASSDVYRNHISTKKTIGFTCDILLNTFATGSAIRQALVEGAEGTLLWGLEGTATGKPKGGAYVFITTADENMPYDDVAMLNVEWALNQSTLLFDHATDVW